jgi:Mannose-6-phosphate isomerase C-terminal
MDSTLLDREFQYTAGPDDAAEWVRLLGVSTVVTYATFTFSRFATPTQVNEFAAALKQKGLGATLLPLRPLDTLDPSDLDGSDRAARRRRFLCGWHRAGRSGVQVGPPPSALCWLSFHPASAVECGLKYRNPPLAESIYIPIGSVHRLANPGKIPLDLIEMQVGRRT